MSHLRVPPISDKMVQALEEARSLLAGAAGLPPGAASDEAASVAFGLAHPVHVMGLTELVEGGEVSKSPAAIRVLESRGSEISAFYDVSPSPDDPRPMQAAGRDNPYLPALEQGIEVATRWAQDREGDSDLRLLRIPALYTEALLLRARGEKEETAIVIRTLQPDVEMLRPMPLAELLSRLEAPAREILEADDGRKGA